MEEKNDQVIFGGQEVAVSDKMQNKASRNFYLLCLLIIALIAVVVGVAYLVPYLTRDRSDYDDKKYDEYRVTDISKMLEVEDNKYYLYFYSEACSICNEIKQTVFDYMDGEKEENLYLASFNMPDDQIDYDMDASSIIGVTSYTEVKIKGYPTMIEVENGEVIGVTTGASIGDMLRGDN